MKSDRRLISDPIWFKNQTIYWNQIRTGKIPMVARTSLLCSMCCSPMKWWGLFYIMGKHNEWQGMLLGLMADGILRCFFFASLRTWNPFGNANADPGGSKTTLCCQQLVLYTGENWWLSKYTWSYSLYTQCFTLEVLYLWVIESLC